MHGDRPAGAVREGAAQPPNPDGEPRDASRLRRPSDGRGEADECVWLGLALAIPGAPAADRDLELHRRLEPVQVGSVELAHLDQAHGPARIATGRSRTTLDFAR